MGMVTIMLPILNFGVPNHISRMDEATFVTFCIHVSCIKLAVLA